VWVEKKWVNSVSASDQHTPIMSEQRNEHYFITNCDLKSQTSSKKNHYVATRKAIISHKAISSASRCLRDFSDLGY